MSQQTACLNRRQQGRTLLEVMIAMAIGLVILTALGVAYIGTTQTDRQITSVNRMSEDAAIAFKLMGDNLRTAGFSPQRLLERAGAPVVGGQPQPKFVSNLRGSAGIYGCDNGFESVSANFNDLQCSATGGSSAVAIRFEDAAAPAGTSEYPFDCAGNNVTINEAPVAGDRNFAPVESRFLVQGNGEQASLQCAGNGNSFIPSPLIQYVERLQLRYEIAEGPNTFRYVTASYINDTATSANWADVVSVRVCLLMRSQNRDQSSSASSYTDCDGLTASSTDGYLRRVFTTTYALRNHIGLAGS